MNILIIIIVVQDGKTGRVLYFVIVRQLRTFFWASYGNG